MVWLFYRVMGAWAWGDWHAVFDGETLEGEAFTTRMLSRYQMVGEGLWDRGKGGCLAPTVRVRAGLGLSQNPRRRVCA